MLKVTTDFFEKKKPSFQKNKELWSAVAIQQHMSQRIQLLTSPPPPSQQQPVFRSAGAPLTLAEKIGIVAPPPALLTESEWLAIERQSQLRGDSELSCSICCDEFGMSAQVLLSCSHVFHSACLGAFEKFASASACIMCCPLCRKERYQKRLVPFGRQVCERRAATKIQAWFRGCVDRRKCFKMRLDRDPRAKRLFYASKLSKLSDKLAASVERDRVQLDSFFAQLDNAREQAKLLLMTKDDWDQVRAKSLERGAEDCPICMMPMNFNSDPSRRKPFYVCSCSHRFHKKCLDSFEKFSSQGVLPSGVQENFHCPVCRQFYIKEEIQ